MPNYICVSCNYEFERNFKVAKVDCERCEAERGAYWVSNTITPESNLDLDAPARLEFDFKDEQ